MSDTAPSAGRDRCVLTIDVEEYFQSAAFDGSISPGDWDYLPSRVAHDVDAWLERLGRYDDARATFFFLGWIGERHAELVRRVASAGHEVASRGWGTEPVAAMDYSELRDTLRRARESLGELTGGPILGYRAARPVERSRCPAFCDALIETGHLYDSSLLRVSGEVSDGSTRSPAALCILDRPGGRLLELPIGGLELGPLRLAGTGSCLRHLPYWLTSRRIGGELDRGGRRVRLRSWEIDPDQPRIPIPPHGQLRQYRNLDRMSDRLDRLFSEFRFTSVADAFGLRSRPEAEATTGLGMSDPRRQTGSGSGA